MFPVLEQLESRLKGAHWLFPVTAGAGALLYVLLAIILAVSSRAPVLDLFGDPFVLFTGALAFAAFWGGTAILATMGYPRILLITVPVHAIAYFGLGARALWGPPITGDDAILAVVNVFAYLAVGVLAGLLVEGAGLWEKRRQGPSTPETPEAH